MIYEIGGWIFLPGSQELHTIIKLHRNTLLLRTAEKSDSPDFYWHYSGLDVLIENETVFYIRPTAEYDILLKEIVIANLKFKGTFE